MVTHLLFAFFLLGSIAGWIAHGSPAIIWQVAGVGILFLIAPHLASSLLNLIAELLGRIISFLLS